MQKKVEKENKKLKHKNDTKNGNAINNNREKKVAPNMASKSYCLFVIFLSYLFMS
jgi:hypothetical protein